MINKYNEFIFEDNSDIQISDDIKNEVKDLIEKTIEKNGGDFNSFVEDFKDSSKDIKINGLINDSDVFEFYLKWQNDIDPILNSIRFFNNSPMDVDCSGLYKYVVEGTMRAIDSIVSSL
jgi:hypothetical protein